MIWRVPIERPIDFAYGYRMRCDCGAATYLSGQTYLEATESDAHVDCHQCHVSIWIGPAVAALRDDNDPALDNLMVPNIAWYHTSTWADWPTPDYRSTVEERFSHPRIAANLYDVPAAIERYATQALHLGTYEAAIENMLRRMNDQGDSAAQFYLYRVHLNLEPDRIEPGYRDENNEEAAQISINEFEPDIDAIRYLNVHEALGSLSLAVRPSAIGAVQQIAIPVLPIEGLPADLVERLALWESERQQLDEEASMLPPMKQSDLAMFRFGLRPDPDGIRARAVELGDRRGSLWNAVTAEMRSRFLTELSPVVASEVVDAVGRRKGQTPVAVTDYAIRFAATAALLTSPDAVIGRLAGSPPLLRA